MEAHIHVSLTDDHPYAQAFVIIEALAAEGTALAADPSNV
jgi:holo-[acyl-carrier protein] synthase